MNIIIYSKEDRLDSEFLEYVKQDSPANIIVTHTKEEVVRSFMDHEPVEKLILLNMMLRPDLGIIKFIKDHYPETRIIAYSSSEVKEVVDIIKDVDLIIFDNNLDNLKKIKTFLFRTDI